MLQESEDQSRSFQLPGIVRRDQYNFVVGQRRQSWIRGLAHALIRTKSLHVLVSSASRNSVRLLAVSLRSEARISARSS